MRFGNDSTLFGTEKEEGKLDAILSAVYQTAFGQDVFLVKDHPFNDGCKRIAATLFLTFLQKNGVLIKSDGRQTISNGSLVAMTLLIAESHPEEKPVLISVIMNILGIN